MTQEKQPNEWESIDNQKQIEISATTKSGFKKSFKWLFVILAGIAYVVFAILEKVLDSGSKRKSVNRWYYDE
jgi:hypothetical protein